MKRNFVILGTLVFLGLVGPLAPLRVSASNIIPACSDATLSTTAVCKDVQAQSNSNNNVVIGLIVDVINVLSVLVGSVAIIVIIISAIKLVASGGEANAVSSAKSGLIAAIIGIIIVSLAQTIVILVLDNIK